MHEVLERDGGRGDDGRGGDGETVEIDDARVRRSRESGDDGGERRGERVRGGAASVRFSGESVDVRGGRREDRGRVPDVGGVGFERDSARRLDEGVVDVRAFREVESARVE